LIKIPSGNYFVDMSFSICEHICVFVAISPGSIPDDAVFFKLFRVLADNSSGVDLNF